MEVIELVDEEEERALRKVERKLHKQARVKDGITRRKKVRKKRKKERKNGKIEKENYARPPVHMLVQCAHLVAWHCLLRLRAKLCPFARLLTNSCDVGTMDSHSYIKIDLFYHKFCF